jgi:hypothetical protein
MDEVGNKHTDDLLARWWWPGQWLHIVWGVWVDQVWYRRKVQPKLNDPRGAWGVFAQSVLGTMAILALFLALVIIVSGSASSTTESSLLIVLVITAIILILGVVKVLTGKVDEGVAFVSLFVPAYVIPRFIQWRFLQGLVGQWVGFLFLCIALGLAYGVYEGIPQRNGGVSVNVIPVFIALIVNMPSIITRDNGEYGSGLGFFLIAIELATAVFLVEHQQPLAYVGRREIKNKEASKYRRQQCFSLVFSAAYFTRS